MYLRQIVGQAQGDDLGLSTRVGRIGRQVRTFGRPWLKAGAWSSPLLTALTVLSQSDNALRKLFTPG